jgi:hypothetical protein
VGDPGNAADTTVRSLLIKPAHLFDLLPQVIHLDRQRPSI